jgi:thiol-disulfide isomerase/thioredoxin
MSTTAMKQFIILLCILCSTVFAGAQGTIKWEDVEVRDSAGTPYPMAIWQRLVSTGKYTIRLSADKKTAVLAALSEAEIESRLAKMGKPRESNFFNTGRNISLFSEKDINGLKFNQKDLVGKVVVLNFWFINCPPCRREMPELNELVELYKAEKDVVFLAVALDMRYDIQEFLKTNPFNYNIIDNGRFIASKYAINLFPTHVVVDRQGKILFHTSGYALNTVAWVKKAIAAGLENKPLE